MKLDILLPSMRKFIMAVGLPFSGKSTAAKEYTEKGYEVISRDNIMAEIINHPEFIKIKEDVLAQLGPDAPQNLKWNITSKLITEQLAYNVVRIANESTNNIFYDGTNIKAETRKPVLENLENFTEIEAIVFPATGDEIIERARKAREEQSREGFHGDSVHESDLIKMISWYQAPSTEEGFTRITEYRPPNELTREFKITMK